MTKQEAPAPGRESVYPLALAELANFVEREHAWGSALPLARQQLLERVSAGREKYGTYLETHNGRDALRDAWEEAADLFFYLKQYVMEQPFTVTTRERIETENLLNLAMTLLLTLTEWRDGR